MRKLGGILLLTALMVCVHAAQAQPFGWRPVGFGGYVVGGGFSYARGPLRVSGGFVGGQLYGFAPYGPRWSPWVRPCWSPWWGWGGPWNRVTVISYLAPPPPPVIILPVAVAPAAPAVAFLDDPPAPRVPIQPVVPPPQPGAPPPVPEQAAPPARNPEQPPQPPRRPAILKPLVDEFDLAVQQGREAFRVQEYGRATQRFREALRQPDRDPAVWFLLAQSLIAQGKYHPAYDAVLEGLGRRPDWPESDFRPIELYEDAVEYGEQLQTIARVLERHPTDNHLLFLQGYLLWFDGRRDEAGVVFRRLIPQMADTRMIDRFLRALPAGQTL